MRKLIILTCLLFVASSLYAAEKKTVITKAPKAKAAVEEKVVAAQPAAAAKTETKEAPAKVRKPIKDMSKDELIAGIKNTLGSLKDVISVVPELKEVKDEKGEQTYTYKGEKLEALDKKTLGNVMGRVNMEATKIRTDRLTRQLETIRQAQRINTIARMPPSPPTVQTAPQLPPQPPRIQKLPPQPPRR